MEDNRYILASSEQLCIHIDEHNLWEPGDFWDTYNAPPVPEITIDSIKISDFGFSQIMTVVTRYDETGHVAGQHSGGYEVCPVGLNLSEGNHNLIVTISSTSGIVYSLERDFVVVRDE